ncbi:Sterol regulatory element-binding protein ECM22 [Tolypocladium ophioglossoides CBS 100239]|uniref:Sterol regulatory element-binding protein ECM22 n=1 Tax=Tolypocladium ophioglossoides (strain CBS 100239) TaxID=1163406 RepID=A0A0L0N5M8_TOLOC|nr:Sterol regulatory element-binding protein ECM22 [Tolypocladium ophioglossoides CBS 100239]
MPVEESPNYALFRDCLSTALLRPQALVSPDSKRRRRAKAERTRAARQLPAAEADPQRDAEELAEFIDYLASSIFESLPEELRSLDNRSWRESERLQVRFALPLTAAGMSTLDLPPSIPETLVTYSLVSPDPTLDSPLPPTTEAFLVPILTSYLESSTAPPPATPSTRTEACEICERSWIPLSYHHLIPRFVHDKAVKRGWHRKEDLQNVAWLCGACHRFVHHFKGHEELARDYYTVELLLAEDEVKRFAAWAGRLRWKGGRHGTARRESRSFAAAPDPRHRTIVAWLYRPGQTGFVLVPLLVRAMVKPDPDTPAAETTTLPSRQRKWHPRVFTGCVNCRRRHVKCDERTPSCTNCTRLELRCNFDRKFVFKAVRPTKGQQAAVAKRPLPSTDRHASTSSASPSSTDDTVDDVIVRDQPPSGELVPAAGTGVIRFSDPDTPQGIIFVSAGMASTGPVRGVESSFRISMPDPAAHVNSNETLYYQHFLNTVSTYLIIYDTPSNSNPYRMLPNLVGNSGLLQDTMKALGAMHLSGLPQAQNQRVHRRAAMKTYASVVTRLRDIVSSSQGQANLELLATSLLLCMFEKMSATDASWKVHLLGAGQIFQSMYSPRTALPASDGADGLGVASTLPLRRFLVSMMSYLDVAASCATGEGPLIPGDYWETLGGGWEYNLGVPSFATTRSAADRTMAQLRNSWSRIMSIQTEISRFAKLLRSKHDQRQREMIHSDLTYRLKNWHDSAPDIFLWLDTLNSMPDDATEEDVETLTTAACIHCYALGCTVYLERLTTRRIGSAAFDSEIETTLNRILTLIFNFSSGINQLAILWPLLTAGIATVDPQQQDLVLSRLNGMKNFGFKHVFRVLETLEFSWEHMRLYGGVNYEEFEAMISSNLVP